jgi:hypothetical protein
VGPRAGLDGCVKSLPRRDSIPDSPAGSESLYRLSYPGPTIELLYPKKTNTNACGCVKYLSLRKRVIDNSQHGLHFSEKGSVCFTRLSKGSMTQKRLQTTAVQFKFLLMYVCT